MAFFFETLKYNTESNLCSNTATGVLTVNRCDLCSGINPPCTCPGLQCPLKFKIYGTFTPNNDGINDTWIIDSLSTDNSLVVVDKWGNEVYKVQHYAGDWKGTQNGKQLPSGVYYYFLAVDAGKNNYSGAVAIIY